MSSWNDMVEGMNEAVTEVFGETVTYSPIVGDDVEIQGVFDANYLEIDPETGAAIQSTNPMLGINSADLDAEPTNGDQVTVRSVLYNVIEWQPDSEGHGKLVLKKAAL